MGGKWLFLIMRVPIISSQIKINRNKDNVAIFAVIKYALKVSMSFVCSRLFVNKSVRGGITKEIVIKNNKQAAPVICARFVG